MFRASTSAGATRLTGTCGCTLLSGRYYAAIMLQALRPRGDLVRSALVRYVSRRLLSLIFVWLGISLLTFGLANLAPGDPALIILQRRNSGAVPSEEQLQQLRHQLGLDDPFPVRYARWLARASHGDLGTSYRTGEPVTRMLGERFPATLELALSALLFGLAVSLPLGVLSALRRDSAVDHAARFLALV